MEEKKTARPRGADSAKVIQVIVTEAFEGRGTKDDPCRIQRKYWSLEGELLAIGEARGHTETKADISGHNGLACSYDDRTVVLC